jgi:hypothetical protein
MRPNLRRLSDIRYGVVIGYRPLELDLYLPPAEGLLPVVVYVHGGGWQRGSRRDPPPLLDADFCRRSSGARSSSCGHSLYRPPRTRAICAVYYESVYPVVRRARIALTGISILCWSGFLAVIGHHNFWRSHGDLLNLVIGGLIVVSVLPLAVGLWSGRERSRTSRPL